MEQKLAEWENRIVLGQFHDLRGELSKLNYKNLPDKFRPQIGLIANRAGFPDITLKVLNKRIYPEKALESPPTEEERFVYGAALMLVGAQEDSKKILKTIDDANYPEALLYLAISHFSDWDYYSAIPYLQKFIKKENVSEYRKMIGGLNLASAYLFLQEYDRAHQLLSTILSWKQIFNHGLLKGNALENLSQLYIWTEEHQKAQETLLQAEKELQESSKMDQLLVQKWKVVNKIASNRDEIHQLDSLFKPIQNKAKKIQAWEVLRDCDFYLAFFSKNKFYYDKLYFGTPYVSYRRRLDFLLPHYQPSDNFIIKASAKRKKNISLDIQSGVANGKKQVFKFQGLLHRLVLILSSDMYKPLRTAEVFSRLYPEEVYNPFSSPHKIQEAVYRLNKCFAVSNLPLGVSCFNGSYSLISKPGIQLFYREILNPSTPQDNFLKKIEDRFSGVEFSLNELALFLDISPRQVRNRIDPYLEKDLISKSKKGRKVFYTINDEMRSDKRVA